MSSRGKGGNGYGAKRHRKIIGDFIQGMDVVYVPFTVSARNLSRTNQITTNSLNYQLTSSESHPLVFINTILQTICPLCD